MNNTFEKAKERVIARFGEKTYYYILMAVGGCVQYLEQSGLWKEEALDGDETLLIAKLLLAKLDEVNGNE